jgi:hypothetical protein
MTAAAATFGKILQVGGPGFTQNVLEVEVQPAVELMTVDKTEHGRYAGILILTEISTHAGAQFYRYVSAILEKVVVPMRDPRVSLLLSRIVALFDLQMPGKYSKGSIITLIKVFDDRGQP